MPGPVIAMARRYMTQPTHIRAADPDDEGLTKRDIRQLIYRAHSMDKVEVVARILQARGRGRTIIFTKTKRTAAKVAEELVDRGFAAAAIHGDFGQAPANRPSGPSATTRWTSSWPPTSPHAASTSMTSRT